MKRFVKIDLPLDGEDGDDGDDALPSKTSLCGRRRAPIMHGAPFSAFRLAQLHFIEDSGGDPEPRAR